MTLPHGDLPTDTAAFSGLHLIRAQLGDRVAMEKLLVFTRPWLLRYLVSLLGPQDAEDAVQDVFVAIWRSLADLEHPRAYRAWVYRIATRHAMRVLAKRRRHRQLDTCREVEASAHSPLTPYEIAQLEREIAHLTPNSASVVALHYTAGLSIARVADVLGVPEGTVKSRLASALSALRRKLRKEHP